MSGSHRTLAKFDAKKEEVSERTHDSVASKVRPELLSCHSDFLNKILHFLHLQLEFQESEGTDCIESVIRGKPGPQTVVCPDKLVGFQNRASSMLRAACSGGQAKLSVVMRCPQRLALGVLGRDRLGFPLSQMTMWWHVETFWLSHGLLLSSLQRT